MGLEILSLDEVDISATISLVNKENVGSYEFIPLDVENIRSWIDKGGCRVLVAKEKRKVLGSISHHESHWGEEIEWLAVHQFPDRKSIEDLLLLAVEKQIKTDKLFSFLDEGSSETETWASRGYEPSGILLHLKARPSDLGPPLMVSHEVVFGHLLPGEEEKLVRVVNAGFGWKRLKTGCIQEWKTQNPPFNEEWVRTAQVDDNIISAVVAKPDTRFNDFYHKHRGYLGPATTITEARGKNIGSELTRQASLFLFGKGFDQVALHTGEHNTSSLGLLKKVGFKSAHRWVLMSKSLSKSIPC